MAVALSPHVDLFTTTGFQCEFHFTSRDCLSLDEDSADLLSKLDVAAFKIPSGEITNVFLLAHIARKGKPMIVSTGMCNLGEVDAAVRVLLDAGNKNFVLLHCVSNYPTNPDDVNLRAMLTMREAFNAPVGFSDHTLGIEIPIAAVHAKRIGGRFQYDISVTDYIEPSDWCDQPDPLFYITARYNKAIEQMIKDAPEQYLWLHRRWKSRPQHEIEDKPMPKKD